MEIVDKMLDEVSTWFLAQQLDREGEQRDEESVRNQKRKWSKPHDNWVKCNFGVKWVKKHQIVGAA